jgi:hypothetical protein
VFIVADEVGDKRRGKGLYSLGGRWRKDEAQVADVTWWDSLVEVWKLHVGSSDLWFVSGKTVWDMPKPQRQLFSPSPTQHPLLQSMSCGKYNKAIK